MSSRYTHPLDFLLIHVDQALRTLTGHPDALGRTTPADTVIERYLTPQEQQQAARLMRINHCGEVCAQALYHGQALTSWQAALREQLQQAAREEGDHLQWCAQRLRDLESFPSRLNPIFYSGAFFIGAFNGAFGDRWNLGFLAETERQVVQHLADHLKRLPPSDEKSRAILTAMQKEEGHHAEQAEMKGGMPLPFPVRWLMKTISQVMTHTTYWF